MQCTGKKVAILVEELFNIYEYWYPYYRLLEEGAEVVTVGTGRAEIYAGKPATEVKEDVAADAVRAADFDGIIIPGGFAPDMMRRSEAMVKLVADGIDQGKVVAAICHAGWMLASAKNIQGRKLTSYYSIKDDMVHAGADWVDEAVVVDGNLITSRTPADLPVFMPAIIKALSK